MVLSGSWRTERKFSTGLGGCSLNGEEKGRKMSDPKRRGEEVYRFKFV